MFDHDHDHDHVGRLRWVTLAASVAGLLVSFGCGESVEVSAGATSSSILRIENTLFVTSPDDEALVRIDATSLEVIDDGITGPGAVFGGPDQMVPVEGGFVVGLTRRPGVAWLREAGTPVFAEVPCGGVGGGAAVGARVFFVCPNDDRMVELAFPGELRRVFAMPGGPTRVAVVGEHVVVTRSRTGEVARYLLEDLWAAPEGDDEPLEVEPALVRTLEPRPGFAATQVDVLAVDPDSGALAVGYQVVDHDSDRGRPAAQGGYGAVLDDAPRIEPRVLAGCGGRYARFDGGVRAQSGPSAAALAGGYLWLVHRQTDSVSVHPCRADAGLPEVQDDLLETLAVFSVGRGPRGITLSEDGRTAWVDVAFDHAVARLELPDEVPDPLAAYLEPAAAKRRALEVSVLSEAARRGRSLFFDAVNTHLTPSGVVTCGTCHPAGGQDGLTWFLHTPGVPRKLRRTPPAWGARPTLAPFHWDAEFSSAPDLAAATIRELMEGDGLLVDVDAIAAYMAELPPPPPRPVTDSEAVARGAEVFEAAGCAECHLGELMQDGLRHAVLEPSSDPDARLDAADTPSLIAVRARPPYLHDGRAASLMEVLVTHNPRDRHGVTSDLDPAALDALVRYLESL